MFFDVINKPQTWRNAGYLLLAFPLGIFYFVFIVTGLSLGLGLFITLLGIPVLIGVLVAVYGMGEFERMTTNSLLDLDTEPANQPPRGARRTVAQAEGAGGELRDMETAGLPAHRVSAGDRGIHLGYDHSCALCADPHAVLVRDVVVADCSRLAIELLVRRHLQRRCRGCDPRSSGRLPAAARHERGGPAVG